jgi:hypothetical protein
MARHYQHAADAAGPDEPRAVDLTAEKDKARGTSAGQVEDQKSERRDCAASVPLTAPVTFIGDAQRKADATLIAEFALAGVELVKLADGTWLAQRWGMFKPLATAQEAMTWLRRVTGGAA